MGFAQALKEKLSHDPDYGQNSEEVEEKDDGLMKSNGLPNQTKLQGTIQPTSSLEMEEQRADAIRDKIKRERQMHNGGIHPIDEEEMDYDELVEYLDKSPNDRIVDQIRSKIGNVMTDDDVAEIDRLLTELKDGDGNSGLRFGDNTDVVTSPNPVGNSPSGNPHSPTPKPTSMKTHSERMDEEFEKLKEQIKADDEASN